ncbi:MAG: glucose-6-phosphate isomerase [Limisphaerales bacterium]
METDALKLWQRYKERTTFHDEIGLSLDLSRVDFASDFFEQKTESIDKALAAMAKLEQGAIANPDEKRMVGHYWLRKPELAPSAEISQQIISTIENVKAFAAAIHSGEVSGADGLFENVIVIGIGGSALGPQFVAHALGKPKEDRMKMWFFDNTDPDGIDKVIDNIGSNLGKTLCIVISKSGGTKETRNGMLEAKVAYERVGLNFGEHACAVTGEGSALDQVADGEGWLKRFPMWDWVGGRTSETSAVGLLPAALQGLDIDQLMAGAATCDEITRQADARVNPAARLALAWLHCCNGKGEKDMVILPYKDRLELFSRYLQQLIMESLGKDKDLDGKFVYQGIAVYGNKGSTDQHAYIQQLRDGVPNFFATFIEVLKERSGELFYVEQEGVTAGDYLSGFFQGTRKALYESGRESITITIDEVTPFSVGVLIALYERAVGLYASLVNINAYHQPGVEAGKKAAERVIELELALFECLMRRDGHPMKVDDLAMEMQAVDEIETIYKTCEHLCANGRLAKILGEGPFDMLYTFPEGSTDELPLS